MERTIAPVSLPGLVRFAAECNGKCGFLVCGDCMEGAGICDGDICAVDFTRSPRPGLDACLCYGRVPGESENHVMVKEYTGVWGGMQFVGTRYKQEPGRFRMNCGFEPEAILGVVYACYDSGGRCKWENDTGIYPTQLPTESTIKGDNIGDPLRVRTVEK